MAILNKKSCGITLRCCGAMITGVAIIGTLVIGLALLGGRDDVPSAHLARNKMQFPENEQMLKSLSDEVLREAHMGSVQPAPLDKTGQGLDALQPAAGETAPAANANDSMNDGAQNLTPAGIITPARP